MQTLYKLIGLYRTVESQVMESTWGAGEGTKTSLASSLGLASKKTRGCCRFCCQWWHADGVPGGWLSHCQTACKPARGELHTDYTWLYYAFGHSSPPNTFLKQEGLQLQLEAGFRDYTDSIMIERTGLTSKQRPKDEPHCDQKQATRG